MIMKKLLVFNWKMNPSSVKEAEEIFEIYQNQVGKTKREIKTIIAPSFVHLSSLKKKKNQNNIFFASQDVFWLNRGAYTGEISPVMLKDLKVEYVIIGHSERRRYFQEDELMINRKIRAVLSNGLKVILCIGEKERRKKELTANFRIKKIIFDQLNYALQGINIKKGGDLIIAYEPLWAIGSGLAESPESAQEIIILIHEWLKRRFAEKSFKTFPVLYGGSVNGHNLVSYLKVKEIDGVLVGGASTKKIEIIKIFSQLKNKS